MKLMFTQAYVAFDVRSKKTLRTELNNLSYNIGKGKVRSLWNRIRRNRKTSLSMWNAIEGSTFCRRSEYVQQQKLFIFSILLHDEINRWNRLMTGKAVKLPSISSSSEIVSIINISILIYFSCTSTNSKRESFLKGSFVVRSRTNVSCFSLTYQLCSVFISQRTKKESNARLISMINHSLNLYGILQQKQHWSLIISYSLNVHIYIFMFLVYSSFNLFTLALALFTNINSLFFLEMRFAWIQLDY